MKITQITYTARKGMPSYSHEEIVAVAMISDSGDPAKMQKEIAHVKSLVNEVLHGTAVEVAVTKTEVLTGEVVKDKEPVKAPAEKKAAPAEKKAVEKKQTVTEGADGKVTAQLGNEPAATLNIVKDTPPAAPKGKAAEKYVHANADHKSVMAAYLTKTMGDTWKTNPDLKKLSPSLDGKDFRDSETGLLVPSFEEAIKSFFGADSANVL